MQRASWIPRACQLLIFVVVDSLAIRHFTYALQCAYYVRNFDKRIDDVCVWLENKDERPTVIILYFFSWIFLNLVKSSRRRAQYRRRLRRAPAHFDNPVSVHHHKKNLIGKNLKVCTSIKAFSYNVPVCIHFALFPLTLLNQHTWLLQLPSPWALQKWVRKN